MHSRRPVSMIFDPQSLIIGEENELSSRSNRQNSEPVHRERVDPQADPLAPLDTPVSPPLGTQLSSESLDSHAVPSLLLGDTDLSRMKSASLTLQIADETRVSSAMFEASKKKKTGSLYHLKIDISSGSLGLGVKVLKNNILTVSMLKRSYGVYGPGESAGVRLGDIIVGINFIPCRDGAKTLLSVVKETISTNNMSCAKFISLQCWRCHQLCSDPVPGTIFPRGDDVLVQGFALYRGQVLSEWERWNFVEIILGYMKSEMEIRQRYPSLPPLPSASACPPELRTIHNNLLDLERNILMAKGLRTALCARIISTCFSDDNSTVEYMIRIEDIESGRQWAVKRRYRDFLALHADLLKMSHYTRDIPFPKKRLVSLRTTAFIIEERIVALEQFLRLAIYRLTHYSTMDAHASQALRRMQMFLEVPDFVDCFHPPPRDDQRELELMIFQDLNDFNSSTCQQCARFIDSINLDSLIGTGGTGYLPILELLSQALQEVEEHTVPKYFQQMTNLLNDRQPTWNAEKSRIFIRRCIRRQIEAALFLPLRRTTYRILYSFVAVKTDRFQRALQILQNAPQSIFTLGIQVIPTTSMKKAISHLREMVSAFLPADQGHALMRAAAAVMELHAECEGTKKRRTSVNDTSYLYDQYTDRQESAAPAMGMLNQAVLADPAGTIFSVPEHQMISPRFFQIDNFGNNLVQKEVARDSSSSSGSHNTFFGEKSASRYSGLDLRKIVVAAYGDGNVPSRLGGAFEDTNKSTAVLLDGLLKDTIEEFASTASLETDFSAKSLFNSKDEKEGSDDTSKKSGSWFSLPTKVNLEDTPLSEEVVDDTIDRGCWDESSFPVRGAFDDCDSDATHVSMSHHEGAKNFTVVGADDFLPLFVYVLVQANLPQLVLVKEIMSTLLDSEELYGECGYYMATLEAALQHILELSEEYSSSDNVSQIL